MDDPDDFVRVSELKERLGKMTAADFARAYPVPALHLALQVQGSPTTRVTGRAGKTTQERSYEKTTEIPPGGTTVQRYHDRVAFLAKRQGNPFPNMISVGRALNNDLVVVLSTISKLHGYFLSEGGSWSFIDHRSKNGSRVNDEPVAASQKKPLADGDRIRIGLELQAVFLTPPSLFYFLSRSSSALLP